MLKEIINALSAKDEEGVTFFKEQGFDVLNNFKEGEIVSELLKQDWNEETYNQLKRLAFIISIEIGGRYFGEKEHFEVPEIYKRFRDYIYCDKDKITMLLICSKKDIKNKITKECLEILTALLKEKRLGNFREDGRYIEWHTEVVRKSDEL